jgi:hypothetical protein
MAAVFAAMPAALGPEVTAIVQRPPDPITVPLPQSLALLQLLYHQSHLASFTPSVAVAVLEERFMGPFAVQGSGGYPAEVMMMVLSALGLVWRMDKAAVVPTGPRPGDVAVDVWLLHMEKDSDVVPATHPGTGAPVQGAALCTLSHSVAALKCGWIFNSWGTVQAANWVGRAVSATRVPKHLAGLKAVEEALAVYTKPDLAIPGVVDRVLAASMGTHLLTSFHSLLALQPSASSLKDLPLQRTGLDAMVTLRDRGACTATWALFSGGLPAQPHPDGPWLVHCTKDRCELWWLSRVTPDGPRYLEVFKTSRYFVARFQTYTLETPDGDEYHTFCAFDLLPEWLPPDDALFPGVYKHSPWVRESLQQARKAAAAPHPARGLPFINNDLDTSGTIFFSWPERVTPLPFMLLYAPRGHASDGAKFHLWFRDAVGEPVTTKAAATVPAEFLPVPEALPRTLQEMTRDGW